MHCKNQLVDPKTPDDSRLAVHGRTFLRSCQPGGEPKGCSRGGDVGCARGDLEQVEDDAPRPCIYLRADLIGSYVRSVSDQRVIRPCGQRSVRFQEAEMLP